MFGLANGLDAFLQHADSPRVERMAAFASQLLAARMSTEDLGSRRVRAEMPAGLALESNTHDKLATAPPLREEKGGPFAS